MIRLTLYSKPDCHLCDDMKTVLKNLQKEFKFQIEEVNIDNDSELIKKYGEKIPVIIYKGRIIAKYRIERERFIKLLK